MQGCRSKVADDFSPKTLPQFIEMMMAREEDPNHKSWGVSVDGELGGLITFDRVSPWLGSAHCIFKAEFQKGGRVASKRDGKWRRENRGITVKACRLAVDEMFQSGIGKLSFYPFAGNYAAGALIAVIGGKREGLLEGQTLVDGKPADMWLYGLTKGAFYAASGNRSSNVDLQSGRGGGVRGGLGTVEQGEDQHQHVAADLESANASAA